MTSQAWLNNTQRKELLSWLQRPNGAITLPDTLHNSKLIIESVEGGGITVKTLLIDQIYYPVNSCNRSQGV